LFLTFLNYQILKSLKKEPLVKKLSGTRKESKSANIKEKKNAAANVKIEPVELFKAKPFKVKQVIFQSNEIFHI
jgi:hypothetical protein